LLTISLLQNFALPFISSMSASADVLAMANVEVDLTSVPQGTSVVLKWRGKPLFVKHRTDEEIAAAEGAPLVELRDPQTDASRVRGYE